MRTLDSLSILVPENRELDLLASMLEAEGATALRCPLVQILDLEDTSEANAWIDHCIAGDFDDLILLTGEGLRRLLVLAGTRRGAFVAALARLRTITRGPKPARALREIGLTPGLAAPVPTSNGVLEALAKEDLSGRRIGLQAYPSDDTLPLVSALRTRGAAVSVVTPYRYASKSEAAQIADTIRTLAAGRIGMIVFTASPQIDRLVQVAHDAGLDKELNDGLARTPIAAIGPVVEQNLHRRGIACAVRPDSYHLKPLVRAIVAWKANRGPGGGI